jgi:hypothetical protein
MFAEMYAQIKSSAQNELAQARAQMAERNAMQGAERTVTQMAEMKVPQMTMDGAE